MIKIGVLAFQGSIKEHIYSLSQLENVSVLEVKNKEDLNKVSGLILPGGESTVIGKLIREFDMAEPIIKKVKEGMPIWGTCAGMILLAKEIVNESYKHLGLMDIDVRRNAYGGQLDSFISTISIPKISQNEIPLVFIRSPWVEKVSEDVEVLATLEDRIIAVKQANMLATSFHPELTKSIAVHRFFVELVKHA